MRKRIRNYRNRIDLLISENLPGTVWEDVLNEHLVQISFFQHERLVHLIVTVIFALLAFMSVFLWFYITGIMPMILTLLILCLLVPYLYHYYVLENEVQKMYFQYDKLILKIKENGKNI